MAWPQGSREARQVTVLVRNESRTGAAGSVSLEGPDGWNVTPASIPFNMIVEGSNRGFTFTVEPGGDVNSGAHVFRAVATLDAGERFDERVDIIDYPHIERTLYFKPAEMQASVLSVEVAPVKIGYIMGSGDGGLEALRQMVSGYTRLAPMLPPRMTRSSSSPGPVARWSCNTTSMNIRAEISLPIQ
jgi:hypothetical protein